MSFAIPASPPVEPTRCNRSACKASLKLESDLPANRSAWFNIGNGAWYCYHCARLINELNFSRKPLCFLPIPAEVSPSTAAPVYEHDCTRCRFWGSAEVLCDGVLHMHDLYTCDSGFPGYVQIVARFSSDGPDYYSTVQPVVRLRETKPGLELFAPLDAYIYRISRGLSMPDPESSC